MRLHVHTACDGSATGKRQPISMGTIEQIITWASRGLISPYGHEQRKFDSLVQEKESCLHKF
jgi:hypothetical protein